MIFRELDQSPLVRFLFYPRRAFTRPPRGAWDFFVPVEEGVSIACRFFEGDPLNPWILYFHGNGEVASDYDDIAPAYHGIQANLAVAEYRGYGRSGGHPSFTAMKADAHLILQEICREVSGKYGERDLWIMGRSLGSLSALELAAESDPASLSLNMRGVIFESGFISVSHLIRHLGLPRGGVELEDLDRVGREMANKISLPALVIHGREDSLVPFWQGEELFNQLGSGEKKLVGIPGGEHNNVMVVDMPRYFGAIKDFISS